MTVAFFNWLKPYFNVRAYFFLNFYMWEIEQTNSTCKTIVVNIFLPMKATILDTHGRCQSICDVTLVLSSQLHSLIHCTIQILKTPYSGLTLEECVIIFVILIQIIYPHSDGTNSFTPKRTKKKAIQMIPWTKTRKTCTMADGTEDDNKTNIYISQGMYECLNGTPFPQN